MYISYKTSDGHVHSCDWMIVCNRLKYTQSMFGEGQMWVNQQ